MAFTKMTDDLDIIAKYPDEPYEEEGFTSTAFKASFDQGAKLCKAAINALVQKLNGDSAAASVGFSPIENVPVHNVQSAIETLRSYLLAQMQGITQQGVADGAITTAKLGAEAVTTAKIDDGAVTTGKLGDGAVTAAKLGDESVTTAKLDDGAVTTVKIDDGAVTTAKLDDDAVTGAKVAADTLLEDVTSRVLFTVSTTHGFSSNLTFHYCRALGVVFVGGYMTITATHEDQDINIVFSQSTFRPAADVMLTSGTAANELTTSTTVSTNGVWQVNSEPGTVVAQAMSKQVYVSGVYRCAGA